MHGYCTRMFIITTRRSYAIAVLGVIILSVWRSVRPSHVYFVTNPTNLPAIFLYHILITANMQSKTGFPSSHQSKSYVAPKSRLKFEARCPVSGCWPSCLVFINNVTTLSLTSTLTGITLSYFSEHDESSSLAPGLLVHRHPANTSAPMWSRCRANACPKPLSQPDIHTRCRLQTVHMCIMKTTAWRQHEQTGISTRQFTVTYHRHEQQHQKIYHHWNKTVFNSSLKSESIRSRSWNRGGNAFHHAEAAQ